MKDLYGSDVFRYNPSLWFISPILIGINIVSYLSNGNKNLGMAAQNRPDILLNDSIFSNLLPLLVFLTSVGIAAWFWHLYYRSSRFIKLTDEVISAPKHLASRQIVEVKFSDVIAIKQSFWNQKLIIEHKHGKLTLEGSGFRDKQIKNNVFRDIRKRCKLYIQSTEIK
ncbi:MAG: hypothetical protein COB24_03150 [Hyphomicrobiales bacterium]|nr:MAG: hypothetical protein COB24_03150 [Hyphomicrobiales bacterium]